MYASFESSAERKIIHSFVIKRKEGDKEKEILVTRVLSLCRCFVKRTTESAKLTSAHYKECVASLSVVAYALGCVCPRWTTKDDRENESEAGRLRKESSYMMAGWWLEAIHFPSSLNSADAIWRNFGMQTFTTGLPWNLAQFYGSSFFRESAMRIKRALGQR